MKLIKSLSAVSCLFLLLNGYSQSPGSGYAIDFDGSNDKVTIPYTSAISGLTTELTIEFWVKPTSTAIAASYAGLVCKYYTSADASNSFVCDMQSGVFKFMLRESDNTEVWLNTSYTATADTWYHVAFTADGSNLKAYINGVQKGSSVSYDGTIEQASRITTIGTYRNDDTWGVADVTMDEVRIWKKGLSQTTIRDWMCRKVTSSHTNYSDLNSYYKFDENTGSTAYDSSGTNHGTLTNSPAYVLSGAAIGNESTYSYGSGNSTSVTETHSDGSSFKIDNFTGTPDGAQVYLVTATPNSTTESLSGALESTRYYGTFVVGGTSPTHTVTYDYTGNTNITGGSESQAVLTSRAENSTTSWTKLTNSFDLNTSTDVITQCNVSTSQEYAGGFDAVLQERPGSGYALDFDGTNDYIDAGSSITSSLDDFTLECWMYYDGGSKQWFLSFDQGGNYAERMQVEVNSGAIYFGWQSTSNTTSWTSFSGGSISTSIWYHVAVTNSSTSGKSIYVNGELEATNSSTLSPSELSGTVKFDIGRLYHTSNNFYFDGKLDEVRVWNKVLTQTEIRDWMCKKVTSSHPQYCNLVSYYRCDENTGTTLTDYSGGNNGSLINGPTYALSGAAIGDESTYSYGSGNSTTVTETHSDGSSFKIDNFSGTPDGAHVYLVNEAPNSTTESLSGALESTRYYGTFVVGGTSPTHSITYNYSGNTNITGGTESDAKLTNRADNSGTSWSTYSSYFDLDQDNNKISKCGQTANKEYAAGFDNTTLQERPGSGYALTFDGTNDVVDIGDNIEGLSTMTIETWVYYSSSGSDSYDEIFSKSFVNSLNINRGGSDKLWFHLGTGSAWFDGGKILSTTSIAEDTWTHVAVTWDQSSTTVKMYINGVLDKTSTHTHSGGSVMGSNANKRGIGGYSPASTENLTGSLDELRVWNKVLTAAEIQANMCKKVTSSDANYCNLIAYYRFDENTGSTLYDYAGNANGTLTNGPTYGLSGAPVGDNASYVTSVTSSSSLSLAHADGPQMNVDVTSGTADLLALYRVDEAPNVTTTPSGVTEVSGSHYYGVKAFGSSSLVYQVEYNYNGHENVTASDEDSLKLCSRADNSTASWTLESATLNTTSNTLTLGGQTGTQFIMGSSNGHILPIELSWFSAQKQNESVLLSWVTESEINNDYFEVQRSSNGSNWEGLEKLKGAGTSSGRLSYERTDESPLSGISYYRLKQVDFDGQSTYSDVISVDFNLQLDKSMKIYPNPTSSVIFMESEALEDANIQLYNTLGENLSKVTVIKMVDTSKLSIDLSSLDHGIYILHVNEAKYKLYKK